MRKKYREIKLSKRNKESLSFINDIIAEYQAGGYVLTLRQLYYQLVARDIIPNVPSEYGKLSNLVKEGRMGGIIDWEAIEDRLRVAKKPPSWEHPASIIESCISQYAKDRMEGQPNYIEAWVEKDALSGVLSRVTEKYHIPIMVNRGYSSASAMHDAFNRFVHNAAYEQRDAIILYLGDFDPSGLDMIRDVGDRLREFQEGCSDEELVENMNIEVNPIALTESQISEYNPPPNPAKIKDPRAVEFMRKHGGSSWEVDALPPDVLNDVLEDSIRGLIDIDKYEERLEEEKKDKGKIKELLNYL